MQRKTLIDSNWAEMSETLDKYVVEDCVAI